MKVSLALTVCSLSFALACTEETVTHHSSSIAESNTEQTLSKRAEWTGLTHGIQTNADGGLPSIGTIAVDEQQPNLVYAPTGTGLYVSRSAGQSWSLAADVRNDQYPYYAALVVVDPRRAGVAYAAMDFYTSHYTQTGNTIFGTTTSGRNWSALKTTEFEAIGDMSVALEDSNVITASMISRAGVTLSQSTDRGATWKGLPSGNWPCCSQLVSLSKQHMYGTTLHGGYFAETTDGASTWNVLDFSALYDFAVDRRHPRTIYAARVNGFVRSTDGGKTWTAPTTAFAAGSIQFVAISPVDSRVYVIEVKDQQTTVYTSAEGRDEYQAISDGLPSTGVLSITPDPRSPCVAYAATASSGIYRTDTAGGTCRRSNGHSDHDQNGKNP